MRIVRRTSDFGVLKIITDILKLGLRRNSDFGVFAVGAKPLKSEFLRRPTQKLRFWSFCGGRKTSDLGVLRIVPRTSDFGVLNIINNIF